MKINPTSQGLSVVLRALESTIQPELTSSDAKATLGVIKSVLADLYRRQGPQAEYLQKLITKGERLRSELQDALGKASPHAGQQQDAVAPCFDTLAIRHEQLTAELSKLMTRLVSSKVTAGKVSDLLRRGAEWEIEYYEEIQRIPVDLPKHVSLVQPPAPDLSKESLEVFLRSKRGPLDVVAFSKMSGGGGKQTYSCTITLPNGSTQDLVIRKEDSAPPLLHPTSTIHREYTLLRCLQGVDCPVPRVFEECPQIPGPEGVDGGFYIMEKVAGAAPSTFLNKDSQVLSEDLLLKLAEMLGKLHSIPLESFDDCLAESNEQSVKHETVTQKYRRSLDQWRQYQEKTEHLPSTYLIWLFEWLYKNLPDVSSRPVLVHGDYNVHNILVDGGKITALLDWECSDFGMPEQDLAYIHPVVSKNMSWDAFVRRYVQAGGREPRPEYYAFCQAYSVLRTTFAFNRATLSIQKSWSPEIRFNMVELGYEAVFMRMGLQYTESESDQEASSALTNGNGGQNTVPDSVGKAHDGTTQEFPQKATGGQDLMIFGDEANNAQTPTSLQNWQESIVLTWWDETNQIGGFHRLGHEPNLPTGPMATLWNHLIAPEGVFKATRYIPLRPEDRPASGAMGSGDDTCWHIFKDGEHQWTFEDKDVSAVIKFRDIGPNLSGFPRTKTMTNEFASHHFDIPGRVSGHLTMKGHTYTINGLAIRDRAWGPREWNRSILSHRWVVGTCGEALSFIGVTYHAHDDRLARFGWVIRNGVVTYARHIDILAYIEPDSCVNRGGYVKYVLDDGEELTFQHTPVDADASVAFHHGIPCVDRHCTWTCSNGLRGFSNFETSSNIQAGDRRPGFLVDGIIDDGFWERHSK